MKSLHKYTLFYSWQSDDTKSRKAIEASLATVADYLRDYEGIELIVDQSTLGKSGMPSIDQTILRKIDDCDIFLADITPVTSYQKTEGNGQSITKEVPNPNVLLELGYAMSAVGLDYVIPVAHQGTWAAGNLPFDINHHSIYSFSAKNCDLKPLVISVIEYIKKNGRHRHQETPFWVHKLYCGMNFIKERFFTKKWDPYKNTIVEESTVFFKRRMCDAFPGDRGLVVYESAWSIYTHITKLLKSPLKFKKRLRGTTDPIWMFRGGEALEIDKFKWLGGRRYMIGWNEVSIRRIAAFNDNGRYYGTYVYVEAEAQKPTGLYRKYSKEELDVLKKQLRGYVDEEYAIYKPLPFFWKKVKKQEEDDGCTKILGFIKKMKLEHIETRCRYITDYNFVIAAKGSSFNNRDFDRTSGHYFKGLLDGTVSIEQFDEYMRDFPKPLHDF